MSCSQVLLFQETHLPDKGTHAAKLWALKRGWHSLFGAARPTQPDAPSTFHKANKGGVAILAHPSLRLRPAPSALLESIAEQGLEHRLVLGYIDFPGIGTVAIASVYAATGMPYTSGPNKTLAALLGMVNDVAGPPLLAGGGWQVSPLP